jgi:hypothetical protein
MVTDLAVITSGETAKTMAKGLIATRENVPAKSEQKTAYLLHWTHQNCQLSSKLDDDHRTVVMIRFISQAILLIQPS